MIIGNIKTEEEKKEVIAELEGKLTDILREEKTITNAIKYLRDNLK